MGVAREVGEHSIWPGEGGFGVEIPIGLSQACQGLTESLRVGQSGQLAGEGQLAGGMSLAELLEEQAPEQAGQHPHGQEEAWLAGDPALAVQSYAPPGHDHVHMRMMHHSAAPGVEHRGDGNLRAEVLGVCGDGEHGLSGGLEQEAIDPPLVLVGHLADCRRQGEDDVIVRHRQQFCLARCQPVLCRACLALGAVPVAARVIGNLSVAAIFALFHMTTER